MPIQVAKHCTDSCVIVCTTTDAPCEHVPELCLRALVDSHSSAVAVLDEVGTILYANRAWRKFAIDHRQPPDLYRVGGNYFADRRAATDTTARESACIAAGLDQVLLGERTECQDEYLNCDSIDRRWIRVHAGRFDLPRACRVLVTHEDNTQSKREGCRRAKEHLRRLLDATHILPWEADIGYSQFTYVGEQAVRILGYPIEDWYKPDFWGAHLHPHDRDRAMADVEKYLNTRDNYELEYRMVASDNHIVWLHNVVSVNNENGRQTSARGFSIDISERKEREAALRELSGRLIDAQEAERRRVARELHDDLNQRLALLSIEMEQLGQRFDEQPELSRAFVHLQSQAREISADIHRLSYRLHPSKLDHLGLAAAVKSLCEELTVAGRLEIELQQNSLPENLPKDLALCLFRVTQEALRNAVKHSRASLARVILEHNSDQIRLSVSDDGRGFRMESDVMKRGLGFTSMRERLRLVNGRIEIHSQFGQGTRIEVAVPLSPKTENDVKPRS